MLQFSDFISQLRRYQNLRDYGLSHNEIADRVPELVNLKIWAELVYQPISARVEPSPVSGEFLAF